MFHVGRYDPEEEDRKQKKLKLTSSSSRPDNKDLLHPSKDKKKKNKQETKRERSKTTTTTTKEETVDGNTERERVDHESERLQLLPTAGALRVIAPEAQEASSSKRQKKIRNTKLHDEAFDDLDLHHDHEEEEKNTEKNKTVLRQPSEIADDDDDDDDDILGDEDQEDSIHNNIDGKKVEQSFDPTDEIQRALHMSKLPIEEAAKKWGLASFLVSNLQREGHTSFFPIQALVIPDVILAEQYSIRTRDVCVAAPTGSGKTLAFVLPILNALSTRKVQRLRALIVLPSRDLAIQVHTVFVKYSQGSNLKIGLAIGGQSDFRREQQQLLLQSDNNHVNDDSNQEDQEENQNTQHQFSSQDGLAHLRHYLDPGNMTLALDAFRERLECGGGQSPPTLPLGGISGIDVLVCTPGRLVDHCDNTPGFTLQHLRFLVIDEADRLLSQSYHGWIHRVFDNSQAATRNMTMKKEPNNNNNNNTTSHMTPPILRVDPITWRLPDNAISTSNSAITVGPTNSLCRPVQLRKLLYSATLTKDPQKLAALKLVNPKYFNAHHLTDGGQHTTKALYSMPDQLKEYTVECTAGQKPLVLLSLLFERLQNQRRTETTNENQKSIIVVFTSSLDSTHRLARLLQLLWKASTTDHGEAPIEFSSSLNQHQRSAFMKRCNDPTDPVSVVICSDGMSRGMDIGFVSAVINYDVPGFAKTYVHRCGRTARAGKDGEAISLLKGTGQSGQFQKLRRLIDDPQRVSPYKLRTSLVKDSIGLYQKCVAKLKDVLSAEQQGSLRPMEMNIDEFIPR